VERHKRYQLRLLYFTDAYLLSLHLLPVVGDMLLLYILLELQGLAAYILTASYKNNILSLEAGAKYFYLKLASVLCAFIRNSSFVRVASVLLILQIYGCCCWIMLS
jgi:NADH:ubiquinone oxidoreductase subunit 2 (subunit N)